LKQDGYSPVLANTRWLLLKRPENLTPKQEPKLAELLRYNLKTVRSYLLKEDFQLFWLYKSPFWAGQFLDRWCTKTMRSKIEPMRKMARQLRRHRPPLLKRYRKPPTNFSDEAPSFCLLISLMSWSLRPSSSSLATLAKSSVNPSTLSTAT